ncbi:581_t:CDS:2, partial [Acaulospora morrowiae]
LIEKGNDVLEVKLSSWLEENRRSDWSTELPFVIWAINIQVCTATKQTPYQLIFGPASRSTLTLVDMLFNQRIYDEEELPNSMIIDNDSDQSINDNKEKTIYTNENMTIEIKQSIKDNKEKDSEKENMDTGENIVSVEVDVGSPTSSAQYGFDENLVDNKNKK